MIVSDILYKIEDNKKQISASLNNSAVGFKLRDWFAAQACMESQILYKPINIYLDENNHNYIAIENHSVAMNYIVNEIGGNKIKIDNEVICRIHKLFSQNTSLHAFAGKYMGKTQNDRCKSEKDVQKILDDANRADLGLFDRAYHTQYMIRRIQPFGDNNKRTGRYAMNFIMVQEGYTPVLFNQVGDKESYSRFLSKPDIGLPMLYDYMLRTQEQIIEYLKVLDR
ncbi:MAG: Fic family protein [Rickettsiales bacterium]|jgi:hypothetical protein|nr:Fic family protein [Rickettsiales bacterium]